MKTNNRLQATRDTVAIVFLLLMVIYAITSDCGDFGKCINLAIVVLACIYVIATTDLGKYLKSEFTKIIMF